MCTNEKANESINQSINQSIKNSMQIISNNSEYLDSWKNLAHSHIKYSFYLYDLQHTVFKSGKQNGQYMFGDYNMVSYWQYVDGFNGDWTISWPCVLKCYGFN
jgi:hypothetical protein